MDRALEKALMTQASAPSGAKAPCVCRSSTAGLKPRPFKARSSAEESFAQRLKRLSVECSGGKVSAVSARRAASGSFDCGAHGEAVSTFAQDDRVGG